MSKGQISEKVRQFIFEQIDSVEQLDILLFVRTHAEEWWSVENIAHEMRSSENSVSKRMNSLEYLNFLEKDSTAPSRYRYRKANKEMEEMIDELTELYKVRKQKIFELIFSPLKKGKHFANAFMVNNRVKIDREDDDG